MMLNTGIIRRIDELGRIMIPKELRKQLGIREGEALEMEIRGNRLILEKYLAEDERSEGGDDE